MKQHMSKIYVIINPISGTGSKKKVVDKLSALNRDGYELHFHWTEYPDHASQLAKKAVLEKADCVVVVGGDGTVNEVGKTLTHTGIPMAIIPHGSGDGLARHLGISLNTNKAIEILKNGRSAFIDYGKVDEHMFFCTCGVGYDAKVAEKALGQSKRGLLMYAKNMLNVFRNYTPEKYKVTTIENTFQGIAFTITCANACQYGNNGYIAPKADITDGKMNIAIIKPISKRHIPKLGIQMLSKRINDNKKLEEIITQKALLEREKEGVVHLDGNAMMMGKRLEVEIVHKGLNVIIP